MAKSNSLSVTKKSIPSLSSGATAEVNDSFSSSSSNDPPTADTVTDEKSENNIDGYGWARIGVCGYVIHRIIYYAYRIRMAAIDEYGTVIHEFDPYFNYRATEVRKLYSNERSEERKMTLNL